jgi:hypothetical protein
MSETLKSFGFERLRVDLRPAAVAARGASDEGIWRLENSGFIGGWRTRSADIARGGAKPRAA